MVDGSTTHRDGTPGVRLAELRACRQASSNSSGPRFVDLTRISDLGESAPIPTVRLNSKLPHPEPQQRPFPPICGGELSNASSDSAASPSSAISGDLCSQRSGAVLRQRNSDSLLVQITAVAPTRSNPRRLAFVLEPNLDRLLLLTRFDHHRFGRRCVTAGNQRTAYLPGGKAPSSSLACLALALLGDNLQFAVQSFIQERGRPNTDFRKMNDELHHGTPPAITCFRFKSSHPG